MELHTTHAAGERRSGMALAAMALGIGSLMFFCLYWLSIPAAVAAVTLGVVARRRATSSDSMNAATVGIACGGVALALVATAFMYAAFAGGLEGAGASAPPAPVESLPIEPTAPMDAPPPATRYIVEPAEPELPLQAKGAAQDVSGWLWNT